VALSVLYFYVGFFVLSFIDKGPILYWYLYPMYPLFFLVASSFVTSRYAMVFVSIFAVVMILNIRTALGDIVAAQGYIGSNVTSWKFLDSVARRVFQGDETSFGYFVYAPDAFAYAEKYAMYYESRNATKQAQYFTKLPTTYVVAEPPPPDNPNMKADFWIQHQVNIVATPSATINFPNGYQIIRYHLTNEQIKVPFDPSIDPGITFR